MDDTLNNESIQEVWGDLFFELFSEHDSERFKLVASIPEVVREAYFARPNGEDVSTDGLIKFARRRGAIPPEPPVFRAKNTALVAEAIAVLRVEQPMTLRQLYYRLISAGALSNAQREYKRLGQVMTRLREAGTVPRTWLVDHTRATLKPSSWSGLADFGDSVRSCYRKDFWASLPHHIEKFVEKDAVAGTIQPVTEENDIALRVCRGYSSVSFAGEIADFWRRIEKPIFAFYLGDFDPSGFDIERDLSEKIARYSGRTCRRDPDDADDDTFVWQRIGVTDDDFARHDLLRLPLKKSDKRTAGFLAEHGDHCAEIDAIPPTELRRRVAEAIGEHIDADQWNKLLTVEAAEQETLDHVVAALERKST